jgi:hypothetical protein
MSTTQTRQTPTGLRPMKCEWHSAGTVFPVARRAASHTLVPAFTVTDWPSIVRVTVFVAVAGAVALIDVPLHCW